jgi:FtsZ-interacting cell division protein ZipA
MSNLQLGLIIAGILLVIGVILFNRWQERRLRRRIAARASDDAATAVGRARIEPTLRAHDAGSDAVAGAARAAAPPGAVPAFRPAEDVPDAAFSPPMDVIEHPDLAATEAREPATAVAPREPAPRRAPEVRSTGAQPDPDIESIVTFRVPTATPAGEALSALLQGRFGKPVRWFGRTHEDAPWVLLAQDTPDACTEFAGCLLLADRNGPASRSQLDTFLRAAREAAKTISAEFDAPDVDAEVKRAEMLDRLCADVDVQIGLTIMKSGTAAIAGTRLRGVAEASGFRLAAGGKFEYVHEETGHVEYSLTNLRSEPFTAESLRLTATHGVVFVLDIPRVADPARTFDRMKLAAKRMAKTLQAQVVDDNRRPLDDAALASIRAQVDAAAQALSRVHIEPGSARALALFGA